MKKRFLLLLITLSPLMAWSHGYWLEVPPKAEKGEPVTIKMFYGEYSSQIREVGDRLDKMELIKIKVVAPDGSETAVNMSQTHTHWEGTYTPNQQGNYQILGINDTREVQDWNRHNLGITRPIQYLRTQFSVGEEFESLDVQLQFLDITSQMNTNNVEIYATKAGVPMEKTKIRVVNPDAWLQDKYSNKIGFISVVPNKEGMYLVEIEWVEEVPGTFKGKAYETIRHKCDMTFVSRDMLVKL